jgi:hypothetical protein
MNADVHLVGKNTNPTKKKTNIILKASKEISMEIN